MRTYIKQQIDESNREETKKTLTETLEEKKRYIAEQESKKEQLEKLVRLKEFGILEELANAISDKFKTRLYDIASDMGVTQFSRGVVYGLQELWDAIDELLNFSEEITEETNVEITE